MKLNHLNFTQIIQLLPKEHLTLNFNLQKNQQSSDQFKSKNDVFKTHRSITKAKGSMNNIMIYHKQRKYSAKDEQANEKWNKEKQLGSKKIIAGGGGKKVSKDKEKDKENISKNDNNSHSKVNNKSRPSITISPSNQFLKRSSSILHPNNNSDFLSVSSPFARSPRSDKLHTTLIQSTSTPFYSNTLSFQLQQHARPRTSTNRFFHPIQFDQYTKQKQKNNTFEILQSQILAYFDKITIQQKRDILEQLKIILQKVQSTRRDSTSNNNSTTKKPMEFDILFYTLQQMQDNISKYLKHRISHLYFYVIFCKFLSCSSYQSASIIHKNIKNLTLIQYYTRSFRFHKLALIICLQLQQKYIKVNEFEQSREYAVKSLKLSVLLNDQYNQMKILEYLQLNNYYHGVMNITNKSMLTKEERYYIVKHYNQDDEIPKIFQFLEMGKDNNGEKEKVNRQNYQKNSNNDLTAKSTPKRGHTKNSHSSLQYNQQLFPVYQPLSNFISNQIPKSNLKKFNKNFHGIAKCFKKSINVKNIRQNIKKISQIGQVKKYIAKQNFITLRPQSNFISQQNQSQVMVTHKKYMQMSGKKQWMSKGFPKVVSKLVGLIKKEERKIKGEVREELQRKIVKKQGGNQGEQMGEADGIVEDKG